MLPDSHPSFYTPQQSYEVFRAGLSYFNAVYQLSFQLGLGIYSSESIVPRTSERKAYMERVLIIQTFPTDEKLQLIVSRTTDYRSETGESHLRLILKNLEHIQSLSSDIRSHLQALWELTGLSLSSTDRNLYIERIKDQEGRIIYLNSVEPRNAPVFAFPDQSS